MSFTAAPCADTGEAAAPPDAAKPALDRRDERERRADCGDRDEALARDVPPAHRAVVAALGRSGRVVC